MTTAPFRYFDDFVLGEVITLPTRHVSREDIIAFAGEFDPQPMHLDEAAAATSLLGGLAASGWHTCAILMRMIADGFLLESSSLGSPGIEEMRWLAPVRPGDSLAGTAEVIEVRASKSRPDMGIVRFAFTVAKSDGSPVATMRNPIMFARRPEA